MANEIGEPGPLRLFNSQLGGQASWLLPLAGVGALAAAWQTRLRLRLSLSEGRHQALWFWAMWLLPQVAFFSVANLFHRYYLEMLSPAIAALVGAGLVALWSDYRRAANGGEGETRFPARASAPHTQTQEGEASAGFPGRFGSWHYWRGWLLPIALLGSAGVEASILAASGYSPSLRTMAWPIFGLALVAGVALGGLLVGKGRMAWPDLPAKTLVSVGVLALLVAPTVWAAMPVLAGGNRGLPAAGPQTPPGGATGPPPAGPQAPPGGTAGRAQGAPVAGPQRPPARGTGVPDVKRLVDYLLAARRGERFLLATVDANTAAPVILATGEPVMALGGFSGGDRILSAPRLADMVGEGAVRFFLLPRAAAQQIELTQWVRRQCQPVLPALWSLPGKAGPFAPANPGPEGSRDLFDCGQLFSGAGRR